MNNHIQVIQSPSTDRALHRSSLFLAGTCSDGAWQCQVVEALYDLDLTVYNPYRPGWEDTDAFLAPQITWEWVKLRTASAVAFWFDKATQAPTSLYELGGAVQRSRPVFVAMSPSYPCRKNLEYQLKLMDPGRTILYSLEELVGEIRKHFDPQRRRPQFDMVPD